MEAKPRLAQMQPVHRRRRTAGQVESALPLGQMGHPQHACKVWLLDQLILVGIGGVLGSALNGRTVAGTNAAGAQKSLDSWSS